MSKNIFISDEKRAWMRLRSHTVVFDRDPEFQRFVTDPSGSILHILRIWIADSAPGLPGIRHYLGSVRRCDCGGWMSKRELIRLFRRAGVVARRAGESTRSFRARLSEFLRGYFNLGKPQDAGALGETQGDGDLHSF
jgi:hypothetical protein